MYQPTVPCIYNYTTLLPLCWNNHAVQALEEEMVVPASAAVSAAMGVLGRGGAPPAATAAAENALEEAEVCIRLCVRQRCVCVCVCVCVCELY